MADEAQVHATLETLLGAPVLRLSLLGGGRNSRVFRAEDHLGHSFTAKFYHRHREDPRDRLGTEFAALEFLWAQGLREIPKPMARDHELGVGLMEFIEGDKPLPPTERDVDEALAFLRKLASLRAEQLGAASEACFSLSALQRNLEGRFHRLQWVPDPALQAFLVQQLRPAWEVLFAELLASGMDPEADLPLSKRALSPSDFGFHNALRRPDGPLVFFDFEYFGWDDPAKTLVDVLLHPAMALPEALGARFAAGFLQFHPDLRQRARRLYPLYGLKWCLILLNEFLPVPLQRRAFAHPQPLDPTESQTLQLRKARTLLERILDHHAHFPFFSL